MAGQAATLGLIHLTFCVVAQSAERDRFIFGGVRRALADQPLYSFLVNFSRIVMGSQGAFARPSGRQDEIQDFYRQLVRLLGARGIKPMYRNSGFHPHSTLGYRACPPGILPINIHWFATELLLIESEHGLSRHNVLDRWTLFPPRQPLLPLDGRFVPDAGGEVILSTNPVRRSVA